VKTSRDEFLVDIDREALAARIAGYFNPGVTNDTLRSQHPHVMKRSDRFDPIETRSELLKRGAKPENIVPYAYRPFDIRWLYWEPETKLLDEKRSEYWPMWEAEISRCPLNRSRAANGNHHRLFNQWLASIFLIAVRQIFHSV
jgi:hypothetical protein